MRITDRYNDTILVRINNNEDPMQHKRIYWVTGLKTPKDEYRAHIVNLQVDGDAVTKTDGRTLLTATAGNGIPDGCYKVVKRTKVEIHLESIPDVVYPPWSHLFANYDDDHGHLVEHPYQFKIDSEVPFEITHANVTRALKIDRVISYTRMRTILDLVEESFGIYIKDDDNAVTFIAGNFAQYRALLMPGRI